MAGSEITQELCEICSDLTQITVRTAVAIIIEEMQLALIRGQRIEVRGFGSFRTKIRAARKGRNPQNGETVDVAARCTVAFKPGLNLAKRVDDSRLRNPMDMLKTDSSSLSFIQVESNNEVDGATTVFNAR